MSEANNDYDVAVLEHAYRFMKSLNINRNSTESTVAAQANILFRLQTAITRDTKLTGAEIKQIIENS